MLSLDGSSGRATGRGLLWASNQLLRPMWLLPVVTLRLADGECMDISIVELQVGQAEFEVVE